MAWENRTAISSPCKYQAYIYFGSDRKEMSNNSTQCVEEQVNWQQCFKRDKLHGADLV